MLNRCEPRHRQYTELCNRSSSGGGSPQMGRLVSQMSHNFDSLEDYWEDASVSLRSYQSWEVPSNLSLSPPSTSRVVINEDEENKRFPDVGSSQHRLRRNSFDVSEYLACTGKGRRSFPPPLASCSTLSIKGGGRFVLKEMDADRPHGFFRAQRGNGRLRLQLVMPDEVTDEDEDEDEDEDDEDGNSSVRGDGKSESRSRPEFFDEFGHVEQYTNDDEIIIRSEQLEQVAYDEEDDKGYVEDMGIRMCWTSQDVDAEAGRSTFDPVEGACMKDSMLEVERVLDSDGGAPHQNICHVRKEAKFLEREDFGTLGNCESNHFVAGSSGVEKVDVFGQEIWNLDVTNRAMASLSPWSPKQMCLHHSIVRVRPAFGLAMS